MLLVLTSSSDKSEQIPLHVAAHNATINHFLRSIIFLILSQNPQKTCHGLNIGHTTHTQQRNEIRKIILCSLPIMCDQVCLYRTK